MARESLRSSRKRAIHVPSSADRELVLPPDDALTTSQHTPLTRPGKKRKTEQASRNLCKDTDQLKEAPQTFSKFDESPLVANGFGSATGINTNSDETCTTRPQKGSSGLNRRKRNGLADVTGVVESVAVSSRKGQDSELRNRIETSPREVRRSSHGTKDLAVKLDSPDIAKQIKVQQSDLNGTDAKKHRDPKTKPKRQRKTAEEKTIEAMPLAARTAASTVVVGAHVSAAGGVHNSITNALHIGGNAFALFLKSQRKWENPALKPEHTQQFKSLCLDHGYSSNEYIVPHGSYLVNLATADVSKAKQAYDSFLDDLGRCEELGIRLYNFHPGNTNGEPRAEALARIASRLNEAHMATSTVVTLLENMAANPTGNGIGGRFEDLRDVIGLIKDKSRVGVCLDTCHAFAAGYDLRSPEAFASTMAEFDQVVGAKYLRAVHVNDSKAPLSSHRDLHQNIGLGFLGLRAFHSLVNDPRFAGLPLILETPIDRRDENGKVVEKKDIWAREIKILESLVGMDAESSEFKTLEKELADAGAAERRAHQDQFDKKVAKETKAKRRTKGGSSPKSESLGSDNA